MADPLRLPSWLSPLLKAGGVVASVLVVWFAVALPMREDFKEFRDDLRNEFGSLREDVKNLSDVLVTDLRTRLARAEEKIETNRAEIDRLRAGK
jgi:hypothetical protein